MVTHGHLDHNKISLVTKSERTAIIGPVNSLNIQYTIAEEYQPFNFGNLRIETFPANNKNHPKGSCLGYIITFGKFIFYHAADTDLIEEMKQLENKGIIVAALPCDGYYNMGPKMASEAAKLIKPKYLMPIHSSSSALYSEENIKLIDFPNLIIFKPGDSIKIIKLLE